MVEVSIRRAGAHDIDRVQPLWDAMFTHHREVGPDGFEYRSEADAWRVKRARYLAWIEEPDARMFLAETAGGEAVGYAFARVAGEQATVVTGERVGDLDSLCVLAEHRGLGVGEALVAAVVAHFRQLGVRDWTLGVLEGNDRARAFYERLGLRPYVQIMLGRVPDA